MAIYNYSVGQKSYHFRDLVDVMAKASPPRSGDYLAGIAAQDDEQRVAAQMLLAQIPLKRFLEEPLIPPESDSVTRLLFEQHDTDAFHSVANDTVGDFRNRLLSYQMTSDELTGLAPGLLPEMAAALSTVGWVEERNPSVPRKPVRVEAGYKMRVGPSKLAFGSGFQTT